MTAFTWLALLTVAPFLFALPLTHDAAWQMWIGRQLWHGSNLYSDIIEVNPPLWFWIAAPLAGLAETLNVPSLPVLLGFFLAAIGLSLGLVSKLGELRPLFLVAFLFACLPLAHFGQREHFTLVATIPYVALIQRRRDRDAVSAGLAATIGLFAAIGFALKPHFALIPFVLEIWLRRPLLRPETLVLGAGAAIYAWALFEFEPDYFSVLPLIQKTYGAFGHFQAAGLLPVAIFVMALPLFLRSAFMVAALSFLLVYFVQAKGFPYQAWPALGFLLLGLADTGLAVDVVRRGLGLVVAMLTLAMAAIPYSDVSIQSFPTNSTVVSLKTNPRSSWPAVEIRDYRWPLRTMSLWTVYRDPQFTRRMVIEDLRCSPATHLYVDDRTYNFTGLFADLLRHYRLVERRGQTALYVLERPLPKGLKCRKIY
jgi:hypothetical protein